MKLDFPGFGPHSLRRANITRAAGAWAKAADSRPAKSRANATFPRRDRSAVSVRCAVALIADRGQRALRGSWRSTGAKRNHGPSSFAEELGVADISPISF